MTTKPSGTMSRPLATFLLISLAVAAGVHGQISNPNQIVGDIVLTNTDAAVLAILNGPLDDPPGADKGFSSGWLRADSIDTTPTFNNSTSVTVTSRTTATYEVTVESSAAGISYRVNVDMRLDSGGDLYYFAEGVSMPVFPEVDPPLPDVELDFAECAGIIDVHFVDQDDSPVTVDGGSIVASLPSSGIQAWDFSLQDGTFTETLAVRGDGSDYHVDVTYFKTVGTDPFLDQIRFEGQCQVDLAMDCDVIQVVECVVPFGDGGGVGPEDLGEIVGVVDMLGEVEHLIPTSLTLMHADFGPFNNFRYDFVGPLPPSSGPFLLPNLLRSDFVSPPQGYVVLGEMSFGLGDDYEYFRTPFLGNGLNPRVIVDGGGATDLDDTFVMDPGFLDVDILLAGPPVGEQGSCLEDIIGDADFDPDGDGVPGNIYLTSGSRLEAVGLDQLATGATFSAADGSARVGFSGSLNPPTDFVGDARITLGGLDQERSIWRANLLRLRILDNGTPAVREGYQDSNVDITNRTFPDFEVVPGVTLPVDHHYCLSEVRITFTSSPGTFFSPRLSGIGDFAGTDFEGNSADYGVSLSAAGTPVDLATAASKGLVVMCSPAATYTLTPFVTSVDPGGGTSNTELPPITFSCGCRQVCGLTPAIQINLDPIAECTADGALAISGSVNSAGDVDRIFYTVSGGPEVDICPSDCGIDPSFTATVALSACDNELIVTAVDELGNEASVSSAVTFDAQPPVLSGCEEITVEIEPGEPGTEVFFDVTATDGCSGPISVVCEPPSGSFFPGGETEVTCTAVDDCGGTGQCTFPVMVTSGTGVGPIIVDVPTLSPAGLAVLAAIFVLGGTRLLRRRQTG